MKPKPVDERYIARGGRIEPQAIDGIICLPDENRALRQMIDIKKSGITALATTTIDAQAFHLTDQIAVAIVIINTVAGEIVKLERFFEFHDSKWHAIDKKDPRVIAAAEAMGIIQEAISWITW